MKNLLLRCASTAAVKGLTALPIILCALVLSVPTHAALVSFALTNSTGLPDTNAIKAIPVNYPVLANGQVVTRGLPFWIRPNSSGLVTTNLQAGALLLTNASLVADFGTPGSFGTSQGVLILVPGDTSTNVWPFQTLAASGLNTYNFTPPSAPGWSAAISNILAVADPAGAATAATNGFLGTATNIAQVISTNVFNGLAPAVTNNFLTTVTNIAQSVAPAGTVTLAITTNVANAVVLGATNAFLTTVNTGIASATNNVLVTATNLGWVMASNKIQTATNNLVIPTTNQFVALPAVTNVVAALTNQLVIPTTNQFVALPAVTNVANAVALAATNAFAVGELMTATNNAVATALASTVAATNALQTGVTAQILSGTNNAVATALASTVAATNAAVTKEIADIGALGTASTNLANTKVSMNGGTLTNGIAYGTFSLGSNGTTITISPTILGVSGATGGGNGTYITNSSSGNYTNCANPLLTIYKSGSTVLLATNGSTLYTASSFSSASWSGTGAPAESHYGYILNANGEVRQGSNWDTNMLTQINSAVQSGTNTFVGTMNTAIGASSNSLLVTVAANLNSASNVLQGQITGGYVTTAQFTGGTNMVQTNLVAAIQSATNNALVTANAGILSATNNVLITATNLSWVMASNKIQTATNNLVIPTTNQFVALPAVTNVVAALTNQLVIPTTNQFVALLGVTNVANAVVLAATNGFLGTATNIALISSTNVLTGTLTTASNSFVNQQGGFENNPTFAGSIVLGGVGGTTNFVATTNEVAVNGAAAGFAGCNGTYDIITAGSYTNTAGNGWDILFQNPTWYIRWFGTNEYSTTALTNGAPVSVVNGAATPAPAVAGGYYESMNGRRLLGIINSTNLDARLNSITGAVTTAYVIAATNNFGNSVQVAMTNLNNQYYGNLLYGTGGNFFTGGAGNINSPGIDNTGIGNGALVFNTNGSYNASVGYSTLLYNTSGSNNIALGYLAGYSLTTGSGNIDIGNMGVAAEANIIRIGTAQTDSYIAGIIHGNGSSLTNLQSAKMDAATTLPTSITNIILAVGTNGVWFTSNQPVTSSLLYTFAHKLGRVPSVAFIQLVCTNQDDLTGYIPGKTLNWPDLIKGSQASQTYWDATNVYLSIVGNLPANIGSYYVVPRYGGNAQNPSAWVNWNLRAVAQ